MHCNNCNVNPAVIEMNIQINGTKKQLHLCEACYKEVKNELKTPSFFSGGGSSFDDFFKGFMPQASGMGDQGLEQGQSHPNTQKGGMLDQFGRNLTDAARMGLIDPVIGRRKEIERVIETLNRRNKNNPVLIGEPGVGKTAIAEGLALKMIEGDVPSKLMNKDVYLLDVSSLVANTGIRGQFEERMRQLIAELQERKNTIVFIDEVHLLVGAGSAEGSMDAGNILKPALARGELQIIGATTLKEYRQIEKDAALERRFQPVMVHEPTNSEAMEILSGLRSKYEDYHEVQFTDEALKACVTLSDRYIQDRFLPDKAIDLMDEAGSKINLLNTNGDDDSLKERLNQIASEKEKATKDEDYERAAKLRDEEAELISKLDQFERDSKDSAKGKKTAVIEVETIQEIVEGKTGIPVRKLQSDEQNKMKHLAERLNEKVIGQTEAVEKVAKSIRRNRTGLRRSARPIGSFLFIGPTGVGKTELARTLSDEMFGDREAMIRLDMSEYMEKHSVSKLIGSPPGYVGHEEAGQLTERVRRKPYSIILLDEIEKAHPDVMHMFLQILEDGRLTDSQGRTVSFKDTVIIMTSNAGAGDKKITVGFGNEGENAEPNMTDSLGQYFRPEFLNRFDDIVQFQSLTKNNLVAIVDLMLDDIEAATKEQGIELTVTDEAKRKLAERGYNPTFGARPLRRVLEEVVEDGISDLLLEKEEVKQITVDVFDGEVKVK
ncbi:ATP-dependent Clp protease ATP-binding subunit ClpE [Scopulibacillus darangshiensis]|uniref:ATP-dependent Clp protease ATP-binding subunit ClpE n=1 Tax=Scopulibacillus darangshiensis TaxID=442528 RepID=A0A4R2NDK6_9BACL|nr:ATP-dependent Clp protease ATP-binding subunit [Scopulibacillus darangshiensis]TCP19293.1 ATP-dependent Clp protease ATP-binding subunit ClpE [Scopulibacillus darangshiensis]